MVANPHARDRVYEYLAARGGEITSETGTNLVSNMSDELGYESRTGVGDLLARLDAENLIERDVVARRTYRIALTGDWRRQYEGRTSRGGREARPSSIRTRSGGGEVAVSSRAAEALLERVDQLETRLVGIESNQAEVLARLDALSAQVTEATGAASRRRFGRRSA